MKAIIYIFLGGGLGSVFRYIVSYVLNKQISYLGFPIGTFVVNILGCFIIGILSSYFLKHHSELTFLFVTGFCGGFTTFSTFSTESLALWNNGNYTILIFYIVLSIGLGLLAVFTGNLLVK